MNNYLFSPIKNEEELLKAITYTHASCFELCKKVLGKHLPFAGNVGIFCHYDDEYEFLTELREKLTEKSDNWNNKYYRLHKPIVIPAQGETPPAVYTYLYIRRPDPNKEQVGDIDFILERDAYFELKNSLLQGMKIGGMEIFDRPGLEMIKLSDPDFDVLSFVGIKNMAENVARRHLSSPRL